MTIKEDKVIYVQHNQEEDVEVATLEATEVVVVDTTMKREDRQPTKLAWMRPQLWKRW